LESAGAAVGAAGAVGSACIIAAGVTDTQLHAASLEGAIVVIIPGAVGSACIITALPVGPRVPEAQLQAVSEGSILGIIPRQR